MLNTVRAVVREGKIELLKPVDLPEGTTVPRDAAHRGRYAYPNASVIAALDTIWDNAEDDVYAQLPKNDRHFGALPFLRVVRRESPTRYCGQCAAMCRRISSSR